MKNSLAYKIEFRKITKIKIKIVGSNELLFIFPCSYGKRSAAKFCETYIEENQEKLLDWISKVEKKKNEREQHLSKYEIDESDLEYYRELTRGRILPKVKYWSEKMNLYPSSVKITSAKTRYGSCSSKKAVCFSLHLALFPDECLDYVVIHELAHLKIMNHSPEFYRLVDKYCENREYAEKILKGQM